jgi:hypothetical protein
VHIIISNATRVADAGSGGASFLMQTKSLRGFSQLLFQSPASTRLVVAFSNKELPMAKDVICILISAALGLQVGYFGLRSLMNRFITPGDRQNRGTLAVYTHDDRAADIRFTGRMGAFTGAIVVVSIIFCVLMAHFYWANLFYVGPFPITIGIMGGAMVCFWQECWQRIQRMWDL